ncbi:MAG: PLP-dependent aminotransferase family protein [Pseudolabrys sp.]|nr:PLP-dependent aminotransferase family protein [Pseudolabrys sp.]MDP2298929.1 PLP-dependent aminotransferase family protein [Pseudolabrys sp.]
MNEMWKPDISKVDGPRYLALAGAIAEAIDSGHLSPGSQLPPQRDLAEYLGVTVGTVGRAYSIMKKRQLVSGEVGRGTFVCSTGEAMPNFLPERLPGTIDFACYRSPVFDLSEQLTHALSQVTARAILMPFHKYPPAEGLLSHRTAGATWIRRTGLQVPPERVIACGGGQQALLMAVSTLVDPGEILLAEQLTYSGVNSIGALLDRQLSPVAIDDEGVIPDALEEAVAATGARCVYLQPTVHNPTTATMSEARRRRIADVARRLDLTLIEDDAAISGMTERPLPIANFAPERTIYISSFGKSVTPALRVAYVASPPALWERLVNSLHALTLANSPIPLEIASLMIADGSADAIARANLVELEKRNATALSLLTGWKVSSHPAAFFQWLHLPPPWTAADFCEAARREGVSVVPADNFTVGDGVPPRAVRISVNPAQKSNVLAKGIEILTRLAGQRPQPRQTVI